MRCDQLQQTALQPEPMEIFTESMARARLPTLAPLRASHRSILQGKQMTCESSYGPCWTRRWTHCWSSCCTCYRSGVSTVKTIHGGIGKGSMSKRALDQARSSETAHGPLRRADADPAVYAVTTATFLWGLVRF